MCAYAFLILKPAGAESAYLALSGKRIQLTQHTNLPERYVQQCDALRVFVTAFGLAPVLNVHDAAAQLHQSRTIAQP